MSLLTKRNIALLIALLSALIIQYVGLDPSLSIPIATAIVGVTIGILALITKNKLLEREAKNVLIPVTAEFLADVEIALESSTGVVIPDELKGQILEAIYGHIEDTSGF